MPTRPEPFPAIALARTRSPEVARLFEQLVARAEELARLQDELAEGIARHRTAREARPATLSKRQRRILADFEEDAERAMEQMTRLADGMDDVGLLSAALAGARQQLELDEALLAGYHADDQPAARRLLDQQGQTVALIERFVDESPLRDAVRALG